MTGRGCHLATVGFNLREGQISQKRECSDTTLGLELTSPGGFYLNETPFKKPLLGIVRIMEHMVV